MQRTERVSQAKVINRSLICIRHTLIVYYAMGITINVSKVIYAQSQVTSYQESGVRIQDSGIGTSIKALIKTIKWASLMLIASRLGPCD